MAKKLVMSIVAVICILSVVLTACGEVSTKEPVEVIVLIRSDSAPNPSAGQYVADQLEELGFEVTRLLKTGGEAAPIWLGDPSVGDFHVYTGAWGASVIPRDSADIFDQMYTYRVMPYGLWTALEEQLSEDFPELDEACRKLRYREFSTMEEREDLFETVLWEGMKFSNQVWMCDVAGRNAFSSDVSTKVDTAAGITDYTWPHTSYFQSGGVPQEGGTLKIAQPNFLLEPWNPVEGSSWAYDIFANRRPLGDDACIPDPVTGLYWPLRIESAVITAETGLPITKTLDWVTLEFADEIEVPLDAWADWDATTQKWITVAEKFGSEGTTALKRTRVVYPTDLYETELHDGSTLSIGDFVMRMIYEFDRGKTASPVYDASRAADVAATLEVQKGIKIVDDGTQPGHKLTIDTYSDSWYMDAEENVAVDTWFPVYGTYDRTGFWHMITVGWLAEKNNLLTFSEDKSLELGVDWMDYTKGDSLAILEAQMDWADANNFIPYAPTLGAYIDLAEIQERWDNLQAFYDTYGHFWVSNGPYILSDVAGVEKIVTMDRFENYNVPADWLLTYLGEDIDTTRMGAFPDHAVLTLEGDHAAAVSRLKSGDLNMYAYGITNLALVADIEANLNYGDQYGLYRDLRFNTVGPFFPGTGKLNPFYYPAIREAMNMAFDREYIVDEYLGGLGAAKWTALGTHFPDAVERYPRIVADVEEEYAYDFEAADAAIEEAMLAIPGVTRDSLGKYWYEAPAE